MWENVGHLVKCRKTGTVKIKYKPKVPWKSKLNSNGTAAGIDRRQLRVMLVCARGLLCFEMGFTHVLSHLWVVTLRRLRELTSVPQFETRRHRRKVPIEINFDYDFF